VTMSKPLLSQPWHSTTASRRRAVGVKVQVQLDGFQPDVRSRGLYAMRDHWHALPPCACESWQPASLYSSRPAILCAASSPRRLGGGSEELVIKPFITLLDSDHCFDSLTSIRSFYRPCVVPQIVNSRNIALIFYPQINTIMIRQLGGTPRVSSECFYVKSPYA
jgi:hypothetical protein